MPAPLTRSLGSFAASLKYEALPSKAVEVARLGFTDFVVVMFAGLTEPVLRIVTATMVRTDPKGEARICLGRERSSAIDAALANGVAGHALDYDDVALAGPPSTVLVPAILAAAAIANLRRLDAEQATMAIAIGASLSAGLVANFGTMTKPFHAGRAAASGVTAARLAQNGMTASADVIEHPLGLL